MVDEELIIESTGREYVRSAWLVEGPETDHALCVLLDGEHDRDDVQALPDAVSRARARVRASRQSGTCSAA